MKTPIINVFDIQNKTSHIINEVSPTNLSTYRSNFGDIVLSFLPNINTVGRTYTVQIYNGNSVVRTMNVVSPNTDIDGFVNIEYPIEHSLPDLNVSYGPTYLKWSLNVDAFDKTSIFDGNITLNNLRIVKFMFIISGQSNALGHFTGLSGERLDLTSAAYMRRLIAEELGYAYSEVMPLQCAWGSAAAERWASDDPTRAKYKSGI